jgi:dienelactone hydrolase
LHGATQPVREDAVSCAANGVPGVRVGSWKLVLAADPDSQQPVQLYHLGEDLAETKNVAGEHPERVAALRERLEQIIENGRSTPGSPHRNDGEVRRYPSPPRGESKRAADRSSQRRALPSEAKGEAAAEVERVGPWNLTELKQPPAMRWVAQTGPIHSLLYRGEPYQGGETEVFAFYASPATLGNASPQDRFPGVVLIHGGGGTAFADWVWMWAQRGYAAIAMDLAGSRPIEPQYDATGVPVPHQAARPDTRTRLPNGGPPQGHPEKFDSIGGEVSDDWPYHAAASVIRAHSLLRSFPEVIADRTAVTGISWGGYTTCLVASLDDRFRAAVPVYGCGFLHVGESVQKPAIDKLGEQRAEWVRLYDPSSVLPRCQVPILFVNGTHDVHYPLDSYQRSFELVPGKKQIRIEVEMRHSHPAGWAPEEIGLFIDSYCRNGNPLPVPGALRLEADRVRLAYTSEVPVRSAALHYTTEEGLRSERAWKSLPAEVHAAEITAPRPPAEANTWFLALTDERGAMVTTPVQFRPALSSQPR